MLLCYVRLSDVILIHRGVVGEFSYPPAAAPHTGLGWETLNKDPIRIFPLMLPAPAPSQYSTIHSTGQASLISYRLTFSSQNFCRLQLSYSAWVVTNCSEIGLLMLMYWCVLSVLWGAVRPVGACNWWGEGARLLELLVPSPAPFCTDDRVLICSCH